MIPECGEDPLPSSWWTAGSDCRQARSPPQYASRPPRCASRPPRCANRPGAAAVTADRRGRAPAAP